jgi:branched-chain amino acid transport system permease protein
MGDLHIAVRPAAACAGVVGLAILPLALAWIDQPYYIVLATRVLIFALIASSLNLLIGYGGMVSFGHAAFFGTGAYAVAALMRAGVESAWIAWPMAVVAGGLIAAMIGAISLRTRGVYFIMITLAFAQMVYFVVLSLKTLGGDDGLVLARRSTIGLGLDLRSDLTFYYVVLVVLLLALAFFLRLINAEMGRALQGIRDNATRMEAIGVPTFRVQLLAFTLAGAAAALGGALNANLNGLVSPSLFHWTQSGALMVMVILGGAGHFLGGVAGAAVLLIVEEIFAQYTIHWQLGVGAILLLMVLFVPDGVMGFTRRLMR